MKERKRNKKQKERERERERSKERKIGFYFLSLVFQSQKKISSGTQRENSPIEIIACHHHTLQRQSSCVLCVIYVIHIFPHN